MIGQRLVVLDVLRALAALIVTFHHLVAVYGDSIQPILSPKQWAACSFVSNLNHDAVLFFFVLSGYCIAMAQREKTLASKAQISEYLQRRFWRLMPGYLIALAFTSFCVILMPSSESKKLSLLELAGNLLFLQTSPNVGAYWVAPFGGNGPLWSLSYEVFFYFSLPFLYFLNRTYCQRWNTSFKFVATVLVAILCIGVNRIFFTPWFAFMTSLPVWICGWLALERNPIDSKTSFFVWLGVVGLLGVVFETRLHSTSLTTLCHGFTIASAFYFFMKLKMFNRLSVCLKFLINIGHGSYLLYILHYPLLLLLRSHDCSLQNACGVILLLIVICALMEPFLNRKTRQFVLRGGV
jgi:peptidoglycan/LPS O-acetylase OafA/YrhL